MDDTSLPAHIAEGIRSATPDLLADLAEAVAEDLDPGRVQRAVQTALDRVSELFGGATRLVVGRQEWQSGASDAVTPGTVDFGTARLQGVPVPLPAPVTGALRAILRAIQAHLGASAGAAGLQTSLAKSQSKNARRDELLRRLFDLAPVGVVLIDYNSGAIIEANTAFLRFGGWSREGLLGVPIMAFLAADHGATINQAVSQLKEDGRFGPFDQQFLRPDGSGFPTITSGFVLTGWGGQKLVWLMVEDVTALRAHLAEVQSVRDEALRARAELQTAVETLPHGFVLFDTEDRITVVNGQMAKLYPDLAPLLVPGARYRDILIAGTQKGLWRYEKGQEQAMVDGIMARRQLPEVDGLIEMKSGQVLRLVDRQTPTGGRVGLRIDVTAERDAERRLSAVIEGSQAGTWECNVLTWENRVNERWASMLGWSIAELSPITLMTWQQFLHPDDAEPTLARLMEVVRQEAEVFDVVFRLRHRQGHWVWVQSRGSVSLRDEDGMALLVSGVHVDVSALKAAEQRMAQIIQGAEAGTWHLDMQTGLCTVNDLWARMLGYTLQELGPITEQVWQGLLHPDDLILLTCNMQDRFSRQTWQFQDELRLRHKDGHWVWVASRGQVLAWDAEGRPVSSTGVHIDISDRKRLEGALEAERDFLATLTETSGSGIMALDDSARILFFNREIQQIFELPAEALHLQRCDAELLGLCDLQGQPLVFADLPCRRALASGQVIRDARLRVVMPDGRTKTVSINAAVMQEPGNSARVVCTVNDMTAVAKAEDDLRAAIHKAEAANRAKSQFLANMSHELRTPLNGVLGMAELLAGGALDPQQRIMLDAIRESGVHLLSVVNDVLDLAKIESGKLVLDLEPLEPRDLAARIDAMHGLAARRKEVALNIVLGPGADTVRLGDVKRLMQVLHNLVGNAVKFTETGNVTVGIDEEASGSGRLVITVSDTGIGMSDDQTAHVFEEFTQGDGSITRRFGGTGLGLSIVRRLVGLMEGEIKLSSALGRGTTVTVTLPMPLVLAPVAEVKAPESGVEADGISGLRCLLAEDNPTNRLIMRAMLNRLGISVTLVCDGDEAVEMWAPGRFDLVALDISMPRKDGLTALNELREKAGADGLPPVLAVTAHAMEQNLREYRAAGFAEVVTKPVTLEALANAILSTRPKTLA